MKKIFPSNSFTALHRREKNLKEILSSPKLKKNKSSISNYHKIDVCRNCLTCENKLKGKVSGRVYRARSRLPYSNPNVV